VNYIIFNINPPMKARVARAVRVVIYVIYQVRVLSHTEEKVLMWWVIFYIYITWISIYLLCIFALLLTHPSSSVYLLYIIISTKKITMCVSTLVLRYTSFTRHDG
jgi:hypothetical protein